MRIIDAGRLERGRERAAKAARGADRHLYFHGVAEARYVLRKVFRLVEEEAKRAGIDPLAHQALIQICGSQTGALKVKDLAERLDITPAFASSLVKSLAVKGFVVTARDKQDSRVNWIRVTRQGRALLHRIDEQVQVHVDYFTRTLSAQQTEAALAILMFYAGVSLKPRPGDVKKA
ncbi:MAG TPA: MarR family winged helix-turn-helix transcriptional regulator [Micropepsaceae bacterium]|jgi:DNA-binding MarR family transcriptional regulator